MPALVEILWNGRVQHAIEYGKPRRLIEHLGEVTRREPISEELAAQGIDAAVAAKGWVLEAVGYHGA